MDNNYILPFLWMRGEKEEILREEIAKIYECGIRAVCLEARPHDDFCGQGWWHDVDIVIDEAKKRNMKIWILDDKHFPTGYANGLIEKKYPNRKKLYLACTTADVFGSSRTLTLNVSRMLKPSIGYWDLGKPINQEERDKNQLYGIIAVKYADNNIFTEEAINLTDKFDGTFVTFKLPKGQWRVFVLYKTRTDGGDETYINLIDSESAATQIEGVYQSHYEHYGQEFGKTIAGFFSDEPQFGNVVAFNSFDTQVGRYKMQLPWSNELQLGLESNYGEKLLYALPFLYVESEKQSIQFNIRYDYMNQVSLLYKKNFSDAIGNWCREHGVEYIGHVVEDNGLHSRLGMGAAHYFRAMSGQDMAGIDCIGGQVIYGAANLLRKGMVDGDGEFFHNVLGKMGASCGHLDPKKHGRTMCELFGAYGWSFGVRDMKYLLDHLLVKGVNYIVPHAFSMAEYPDPDCPPHFYARGNNPQFTYFAILMKYANRMCGLLNGGKHVASVAVLYDGEADWVGGNMPMQKICRKLLENQIDFDIVSIDMLANLKDYNGKIEDSKLCINGEKFDALIIGQSPYIPPMLSDFIAQNKALPIIFVDKMPNGVSDDKCEVIPLCDLAVSLRKRGFYEVDIDHDFANLSFYHYKKDRDIWVFLNESSDKAFEGRVTLPQASQWIYYDAMNDVYERMDINEEDKTSEIYLQLEAGECVVLMEQMNIICEQVHKPFKKQLEGKSVKDISEEWEVSYVKAKEYPNFVKAEHVSKLKAVSDVNSTFSGIIKYKKTISLETKPNECVLEAQNVYEVMRVWINGVEAGFRLFPPYQISIGSYLNVGDNEIIIEVATTPAREQMNYPQPPFDFSHSALEPTGMYGNIRLYFG